MYKADNACHRSRGRISRGTTRTTVSTTAYVVLTNQRALSVRVAYSAVRHFQEGGVRAGQPRGLRGRRRNGFQDVIEHVDRLPEAGIDLTPLGAPVSLSGSTGVSD